MPLLLDDGDSSYVYGPKSTPIAQIDDATGATSYLYGDNVGSVRLITDATGAVTRTATYDEYGAVATHTGSGTSAIGYTGNWTDPTSGLVYLRARDYDPATGQFLTIDPALSHTHQPYAYADNHPTDATDPTGLFCFFGTIGVASGACQDAQIVGGVYDFAVKNFDPMYSVITGYAREIQDSEAGCSIAQIASDGLQAVAGVAGTGLAAIGGSAAAVAIKGVTRIGDTSKLLDYAARTTKHAVPIGPASEDAWTTLNRVDAKGSPLPGYKGGSVFDNSQRRLPETPGIAYQEWDVNPNIKGAPRGADRIVTGNDGSAYWTTDHYDSFTTFRGATG